MASFSSSSAAYEDEAYDEASFHHGTTSLALHDPDDPDDNPPLQGPPTLATGPPPSRLGQAKRFFTTVGGLIPYLSSLSAAFGWRYVAAVFLIYGINQGVGEPLIFTAQSYYLLDSLHVTPAQYAGEGGPFGMIGRADPPALRPPPPPTPPRTRYGQIDGFTNIPWQIKALWGLLSGQSNPVSTRLDPRLCYVGGVW